MRWRGLRTSPPSGQDRDGLLERMTGIEPALSAWEAGATNPYFPVNIGYERFSARNSALASEGPWPCQPGYNADHLRRCRVSHCGTGYRQFCRLR